MKRTLAIALLSVGLLSTTAARADETLLGALIGGGTGALIGQSVGGRDGAVLGGAIGAAAGAALANDDDGRVRYYRAAPVYVSRPMVVEAPPPVYYYQRDRWMEHRHWADERREHWDRWHDHDRD